MTGWSELVTTALLGTDRREIPTDLPPDIADFAAGLTAPDPAGRLLDMAAGYTAYARAGALPESCPPAAKAPPPAHEPAPAQAQRVLGGLLGRRAPLLVTEWLHGCVDHGYSVAPELWTGLAELATSSPGVDHHLLRRALGDRGAWFLSHNERWLRLVATAPPAASEVVAGDAEQPAVASFRFSRGESREGARLELDAAWGRLRAVDKVAVLGALAADLGEDDEPTLLRALRDRGGEVRESAARLLSRLPGCGYSRRMADRATSAVTVTGALGRRHLVVTPPERDGDAAQDAVSDRPPPAFQGGPAAFVLRQVLAATDLAVWASVTGLPPSELLELAARTSPDWLADLRAGWAVAAIRQADPNWAAALLTAGEVDDGLVALVPADALVVLAEGWARHGTDPARIARLVMASPRPWPSELAQVGLRLFSSGLLGPGSRFPDEAGLAMSLESYPTLEQHVLGWVPGKGMPPHDATRIRAGHERMEELLATRIAIHQGFTGRPTTIRRFAVPHHR